MHAPGFRWRPWVSASFAWQAWDNVHCQGVGCTPRGSAGVPGSPPLLRGRRGTMCIAKGSDVRPGVPLASLGLRLFCVAGVGQCALPRGRMHAPGFRWRPWVSASFAWQAWDNVHCPGFRWRPWVSASFAWQAWVKAKQLTHKQLTLRTYIHRYLNTYIHTYLPTYLSTYLPTYLHTYHHRPSITLILPLPISLSVLRLSLKKLLTCGVIRSYNFFAVGPLSSRLSRVSRHVRIRMLLNPVSSTCTATTLQSHGSC